MPNTLPPQRSAFEVPESLRWLADDDEGGRWLAHLPRHLETILEQWDLVPVGGALAGFASYVVPVARENEGFILKLQFPHDECEFEADALRLWNGDGAIHLIDHDRAKHALLLERCRPGIQLADADLADPLAVFVGLLPRLWQPAAAPFKALTEEARGWAESLKETWDEAGRPCEVRLVEAAIDLIEDLTASPGRQVLVNQDLHGGNVLAAEREPWLVIDPKPLLGEPEFGLAPIVRSFELGHSKGAVLNRLDRLCGDLGLDRERARAWTIAQTMAWSFGGSFDRSHHETVRWLLDGL